MSSIIFNWSPVLVTLSFTICSKALDSVKMIKLCQSKCEIQAIWQFEPNLSHVPARSLLFSPRAGERECSPSTPGPDPGHAGRVSSGKGPAGLAAPPPARPRGSCLWRFCSSSMTTRQPSTVHRAVSRAPGKHTCPWPSPHSLGRRGQALFLSSTVSFLYICL